MPAEAILKGLTFSTETFPKTNRPQAQNTEKHAHTGIERNTSPHATSGNGQTLQHTQPLYVPSARLDS